MTIGVRILACLLAAAALSAPAYARVEPDEVVGTYELEEARGSRCSGVLHNDQFIVSSATETSMTIPGGEGPPVTISFNADSGEFHSPPGAAVSIKGRFTRAAREMKLLFSLAVPFLDCKLDTVGTKPMESVQAPEEAAAEGGVAGANAGSVAADEAPPATTASNESDQAPEAGENNTLLMAILLLLLLGSAVLTYRRAIKLGSGESSAEKAELTLAKCSGLAEQIQSQEADLKRAVELQADAEREGAAKKCRDQIRQWEDFLERYYREPEKDPAKLVGPGVSLDLSERDRELEGDRDFYAKPADYAEKEIASLKGQLSGLSWNATHIEELRQSIALLNAEREKLGCERLEATLRGVTEH